MDRRAPARECEYDYDRLKADEMIDVRKGEAVVGRLARQEATMDMLYEQELAELARYEAILLSRERPVDALDLALLDDALARLSEPDGWDRSDDRVCGDLDETVSLYCALYFASFDYLGRYEHRRTALQEVRFAIEEASEGRQFEHRLRDFNNLEETSLDDVRGVLEVARNRVATRLAAQADCAIEY